MAQMGFTGEVPYPAISTKAKAQAFIGLDVQTSKEEKTLFKAILLEEWRAVAAEREEGYVLKNVGE